MQSPILVKLKMKNTYKTALVFIGILLILLIVVYILYLFYDKVLDTEDIEVKGMISINYASGKDFNIAGIETIKFSVSNNDDKANYYNIGFSRVRGNGSYRLIYNNKVVNEGTLNTIDETSVVEVNIDGKETKIYDLEIINEGESNLRGNINIKVEDSKIVTFADTILKNNTVVKPLTNIGEEVALTNEGIIKNYDDIGVTYYFRGNVDNNYVKFANFLWRIVRINGDGTVRLILDDVADTLTSYYVDNTEDFDYRNSNINNYLKNWLDTNIPNYNNYLANSLFCNDMSNDNGTYLSYSRIVTNKIPTYNCLATSFNNIIGILSIDELVLAGAAPNKNNTSFYLYNPNISEAWYLMSGAKKNLNNVNLFMFDEKGKIRTDISGNLYRYVRPVINIKKNIEVKGEGLINNPYVIE